LRDAKFSPSLREAVRDAAEKTLPWGRAVTYATAGILVVLGVLLHAAPHAIPGLTVPDGTMPRMST
jgi:hypothetical protein